MKIRKNKILAPLTTFKIGGPAQFFLEASDEIELKKGAIWARKKKLPFFILGRGSNVLISDQGVKGLVIRVKGGDLAVQDKKIKAFSGVSLARLIKKAAGAGLSGLEFLAGIPGSVGGAVVNNAGTSRREIGQLIEKVVVFQPNGRQAEWKQADCQFNYRSSRFKNNSAVILNVVLVLEKEKKSLIEKRIKNCLQGRSHQPRGKSVGSIFKNPAGFSELIKKEVRKRFDIQLEEEISYLGNFSAKDGSALG